MPIVGYATISYLPKEKMVGLSKFDRIVDFFCRRPQVHERLTQQIMETMKYVLDTEDVGVIIKAEHLCVSHRGVGSNTSETTTVAVSGLFRTSSLKQELLALG